MGLECLDYDASVADFFYFLSDIFVRPEISQCALSERYVR